MYLVLFFKTNLLSCSLLLLYGNMDPCTAQDVHTACSTTKLLC